MKDGCGNILTRMMAAPAIGERAGIQAKQPVFNHYRKPVVYRVPEILPCALCQAHGKHAICRVPIR